MDPVIKVSHVSKNFRLPHERVGSVKNIFTNLIHAISAARSYSTQKALKDISFEVKEGEFFGIVGRNGSGKSTLLKLIAGIYQPTKGSISVKGKLVPFIELGVGFNPELTGKENVYLNGALLGFSIKHIDRIYDEIVEFAELQPFMDQKLKNYSSGMQVRLAFAMAVRAEADILLVDEVLAVGDADFQRKCFDYFRKLKKNKKTVVFISHDMTAVREFCDRALLIDQNEVVAAGSANAIATKYKKLFSDAIHNEETETQEEKRWGDHAIQFQKVQLSHSKLSDDDGTLSITVKAKAIEDLENITVGFSITDFSGQNLFGTNTTIKKCPPVSVLKNQTVEVKYEVPNIFNEGTYFVNVAIVDQSGTTTHDWWDEAKKFNVISEERTPYPVNPNVSVGIDVL